MSIGAILSGAADVAGIGSSIMGMFGGGGESHSNLQNNYVYSLFPPQYKTDSQGNVIDAAGNILHKKYNPETGAVYYVDDKGNPGTPKMAEGYEDWSKMADKLGGEGGLLKAFRIIDDLMTGAPGALNDYMNLIDDTKEAISKLPDQFKDMMAPFVSAYASLGEKYLKQADGFEGISDKYNTVWNDIRNQSAVLNTEYAAVQKEYERQYLAAPKTMPTINFGGGVSTAGLPNYKLMRETLSPISDLITNRANLMNTSAATGMQALQGMGNMGTQVLNALQGYGQNALAPQQQIAQGQFNINAATPMDLLALGGEKNKYLFDWAMTQGLGIGNPSNSVSGPSSGTGGTNWSGILGAGSDILSGLNNYWANRSPISGNLPQQVSV